MLSFFEMINIIRGSAVIKIALIIFLVAAAIFSLSRGSFFGKGDIGFYAGAGDYLTVEGEISGEPAIYSDQIRIVLDAERIIFRNFEKNVNGRMLVILPRYPEYAYGYCLKLHGKLEKTSYGDFSYGDFLAKDGVYSVMYRPKADVINRACGSVDKFVIFSLKGFLSGRIGALFSEPAGSIVSGLLLGIRRSIPGDITDDFNRTGLTHILAISGYNITMIISIFGVFMKRVNRRARYYGTLCGIIVFVLLTGMSASVIRAAIMGIFVITGIYNGRKSAATHCLLWSAALMSLSSPGIILFDMSFQLSFLATLGILLYMPFFEKYSGTVVGWKKYIFESLGVTISAQILTTPLILYKFGRLSLIAPVANLIFLPLIPLIMFFAFAAIVSSFIIGPFSMLSAGAAFILCEILIFGVKFFAGLPFASFETDAFPLWAMLVYFTVVGGLTIFFRRPKSGPCS